MLEGEGGLWSFRKAAVSTHSRARCSNKCGSRSHGKPQKDLAEEAGKAVSIEEQFPTGADQLLYWKITCRALKSRGKSLTNQIFAGVSGSLGRS